MAEMFGSVLRRWRDSRGMSQKEVAAILGVSDRSISRWEQGDGLPIGETFVVLGRLGCDLSLLVDRDDDIPQPAPQPQLQIAGPPAATADLVEIRHYAVGLSAGNGRNPPDFEDFEPFVLRADWVRRVLRRSPANLVAAHAEGHSMSPTIADRDLLVIDTADQRLTSGRIYALVVGDNLLVKRIERTLRGQIFLRPDNPAYQTEELTEDLADTVRVLGQVIWHGGSLE